MLKAYGAKQKNTRNSYVSVRKIIIKLNIRNDVKKCYNVIFITKINGRSMSAKTLT